MGPHPTSIMQATDGTFYGTTNVAGTLQGPCAPDGCGTIFHFSAGLAAFVESNPGFGSVGQKIGILGNNLTGTTSVTFNGIAATFKVESDSFIMATVPNGATTGK
jgi:hypothetical protein